MAVSSWAAGIRRAALAGLWLGACAGASAQQGDTPRASPEGLARAQAAVVAVLSTAVEDASSSESLGRERAGSGVLIGSDGLVLTIGYLILEAEQVDIVLDGGRRLPARVVAYDLASGFGLVQSLVPLRVPPAPIGRSATLSTDEPLFVASGGEDAETSLARLVTRRPFSGYWEYHIDGALFTAPARGDHSGAGLFNADGELVGIGSLIVADALGPGRPRLRGNMFVPVDLLAPILPELRARGMSRASMRAWMGVNCVEQQGGVQVVRINPGSPAEDAGLQPGDRIERIDGDEVRSLEGFYKVLWRDGPERDVTLDIRRDGLLQSVTVHTLDRAKTLRKPEGV